jgi:4-amino-4-deoxy-L-arabinose transferase-like glycosyltransferase
VQQKLTFSKPILNLPPLEYVKSSEATPVKKNLPMLAIAAVMILSAVLHLWKIDSIGDSNEYYTAAVESMTQSWHNFFYAAAEPGGSVTVDKPPLGLQIETLFALVLGVSGFSTTLPNILAGVFSVPLLYHLVKKHFGTVAGLAAGLVIATTPVVFAADRNNTQDGMLTFVLLLAAWAFIKTVETGRTRWLFLGAVIVGLGFNIKMLQAYLPVPAFFALYLLGSKTGWLKKIGLTFAALAVMTVISLAWALYVDSVPADERPYIGSSQDNSVMGLITGHNGTSRLFGGGGPDQQRPPAGQQAGPAFDGPDGFNPNASPDNPNGTADTPNVLPANPNIRPGLPNVRPDNPNGQSPNNDGRPNQPMFSQETGSPSLLRFFQPPLAAEMSWLLPFALFSLIVIAFQSRIKLPVESNSQLGLILWGGWLMTCVIFFSMISGIFHSYYVVMLAPALGAVVGGGFGTLWHNRLDGNKLSGWMLGLSAAVTVSFQIYSARQYNVNEIWMPFAALLVALATILFIIDLFRSSKTLLRGGFSLMLAAILIIPLAWSVLTVTKGTDSNLPAAYGVQARGNVRPPGNVQPVNDGSASGNKTGDNMLAFLEENTQDIKYLVAVPSSGPGARIVLATGRPVLYIGGFSGNDNVVAVGDLAEMVADGELRYILFGGQGINQQITNWLQAQCTVVDEFSQQVGPQRQNPNLEGWILYDCL